MLIPRVKGTQDFIDCTLYNFIIDAIKKHLTTYHFTEIQTPILESVDLFHRSLGQHTDVVSKEMFVIESRHEDSKERICLRPEGTAPTVRAFNEHHIETTPWKVFSMVLCSDMNVLKKEDSVNFTKLLWKLLVPVQYHKMYNLLQCLIVFFMKF